ncbi:MAG TPA: YcxB family protein [Hyphomicrobiaceae bacterium]|nr:YcxB family protein [Hyphomicrobiaceae bacterium]
MSRNFDVRYRCTLDDYTVLSKAQINLTPVRRIVQRMFTLLIVLLFIAAAVAMYDREPFWVLYFSVLGLSFAAIRFGLAPLMRRRQFKHQRLGEFDIDFHADEDGFATRSDLGEGKTKWAAIRQVDDLPQHILLWPNNRIGWMIPKRAFDTPQEAADFAALAKEKTDGQTL